MSKSCKCEGACPCHAPKNLLPIGNSTSSFDSSNYLSPRRQAANDDSFTGTGIAFARSLRQYNPLPAVSPRKLDNSNTDTTADVFDKYEKEAHAETTDAGASPGRKRKPYRDDDNDDNYSFDSQNRIITNKSKTTRQRRNSAKAGIKREGTFEKANNKLKDRSSSLNRKDAKGVTQTKTYTAYGEDKREKKNYHAITTKNNKASSKYDEENKKNESRDLEIQSNGRKVVIGSLNGKSSTKNSGKKEKSTHKLDDLNVLGGGSVTVNEIHADTLIIVATESLVINPKK